MPAPDSGAALGGAALGSRLDALLEASRNKRNRARKKMSQEAETLDVFDDVEALPGCSYEDAGVTFFEPGDCGRVVGFESGEEGVDWVRIQWFSTGRETRYPASNWRERFCIVAKAHEPMLTEEVELLPCRAGFEKDGQPVCSEQDRGRVTAVYPEILTGEMAFSVTWYSSGLSTCHFSAKWHRDFRYVGEAHLSLALTEEVEALPGQTQFYEGSRAFQEHDRGRVSQINENPETGHVTLVVTWYRTGLCSVHNAAQWAESLKWVGVARTPRFAEEMEVLPGKSHMSETSRVMAFREFDRGRVSNLGGGEVQRALYISWYSSGIACGCPVEDWPSHFRIVGEVHQLSANDEVEVLPGPRQPQECYKSGERGRVHRVGLDDVDPDKIVAEVSWYKGDSSAIVIDYWPMILKVVEKARKLKFAEEVELLPDRYEEDDDGEICNEYDRGRVAALTDGKIAKYWIVWYSTGRTTQLSDKNWAEFVRPVNEAHTLAKGDEVEALPTQSARDGRGCLIYKAFSRGHVTGFDRCKKGNRRVIVRWKNGATSKHFEDRWPTQLRVVGEAIKNQMSSCTTSPSSHERSGGA